MSKRTLAMHFVGLICACAILLGTLTGSETTALEKAVALPTQQDSCQRAELAEAYLNIESGSELFALCDAVAMTTKPCNTSSYYYVNSGNSLPAVAQTLRKQKYESSVGYTCFGEKAFDYTNFLTSQVMATKSYREEFMEKDGTLAIHNHPSGQPFSAGDLYAEATFGTPIVMVITDGYTYTVQPLEDGWGDPTALRNYYSAKSQATIEWARAYLANTYSYSKKTLLATPESPDDGSFKWFCDHEVRQALKAGQTSQIGINVGAWAMDKAMEDTAQKFNLLYTRELTDEFDFTDEDVFWPVLQVSESLKECVMPVFGGKCCEHRGYHE